LPPLRNGGILTSERRLTMPRYCHIGEVRPGAGIAWVGITWGQSSLPQITFYEQKSPRNKMLTSIVPQAVEALIAGGYLNLIIEEAL
jgi:hypothetical protein